MQDTDIAARGLVLLGCGKMGSALLAGWLDRGLPPKSVWVQDPVPSDWVKSTGVQINQTLPPSPAVLMIAVKPQMLASALPDVATFGNARTTIVSIAAGATIASFQDVFGNETPIVRTMPNTPAAVGQGITALVANAAGQAALPVARDLLSAVGDVVELETEAQMDAVTGVSGSGPAYVFHMIEALAQAAEAQGLAPNLAMQLAKATVAGAGALAMQSEDSPSQLRLNVTSPNGTTQAGLEVLMDAEAGLPPLMRNTVAAATNRSKELGHG